MKWERAAPVLVQCALAGGVAGLLLLVLLLRLNSGAFPAGPRLAAASVLWWTWGAVTAGAALAGLVLAGGLVFRGVARWRWFFPHAAAVVFIVVAVLSRVNADMHVVFLSGRDHRLLGQDAVIWLLVGLAAAALGSWAAARRTRAARAAVLVFLTAAPVIRLIQEPSAAHRLRAVAARPLGRPARALVVVGVEGLDFNFLMAHGGADRFPNLQRLITGGAAGALAPYRPYLRRSLWTTLATGASPREHGVESRWAWRVRGALAGPVRLLPWTPFGSRWILPTLLTRRVPPPPSLLPPLWARLAAAGVPTEVLDWPGIWRDRWGVAGQRPSGPGRVDPDFESSLAGVLAPFPRARRRIWAAVGADAAALAAAAAAPRGDLWIHLRTLGTARRLLQPLGAGDVREQAVQEVVLELLDDQLGRIFRLAGDDALIAVVSPYGLAPPGGLERLRRLLGVGHAWRTSAESCPDGLVVLLGPGISPGERLQRPRLADVAPTLCYLLGLPVAQSMDGRVILDAVTPSYLESVPLRVVN